MEPYDYDRILFILELIKQMSREDDATAKVEKVSFLVFHFTHAQYTTDPLLPVIFAGLLFVRFSPFLLMAD